jgi:hypothetical protein
MISAKTENKRARFIVDNPGIFQGYCMCLKHGKLWTEGDKYEENGGRACKECIEAYSKEEV